MGIILITGLLLTMQPSADDRVLLWRDVYAGESEVSVKSRYPKEKGVVRHWADEVLILDVPAIGDCRASADIVFEKELVDKVTLEPLSSNARNCREIVLNGLVAKYGEPLSRITIPNTGAWGQDPGTVVSWQRNGLSIRLKLENPNDFNGGWKITYRGTEAENSL